MNTKEKILKSALDLFNKDGVENITTRHIASHMGISQGNLHYHFPNKDEVIMALFHDYTVLLKKHQYYDGGFFNPHTMYKSLKVNFRVMYEYRFFIIDREVVWRRIPHIKKQTLAMFDSLKSRFNEVIVHYKKHGIFRKDIDDKQTENLIQHLGFMAGSWLHALPFEKKKRGLHKLYAEKTFRLLIPYLEPNHIERWNEVLK